MSLLIPDFPYQDQQTKVMAILGYTGVGKTSLIAAGYFEHLMHGKDAFTQRFFQRIEDEIRILGTIPLTLGEASTLNFIEPKSRMEFTVQDFSGEHIKLERKDKKEYTDLINRADNSHALICMLSASNFYRGTHIYEEVDALQTFVNKLRGLGTRIPVVVVLTKCDVVPRFYVDLPVLKWICAFFSSLPLIRINPLKGFELTRRRFPTIFSSLNFKGKGPGTVFMGIAMPRLGQLKPWNWPAGLQWIARVLRKLLISPKWVFQSSYNLNLPFDFSFQAFQISMLRGLLVQNYKDTEYCQNLVKKFSQSMVESGVYGHCYFKEYLERIIEDTQSLIEEMKNDIESIQSDARRLLSHERDLGQNLIVWLEKLEECILKYRKPWSEGARQTLEKLRHSTLVDVKQRLQDVITQTLEETGANTFYRVVDILRLRRDIGKIPIWETEGIALPEVETFQKRLLEHLINLTLSKMEVSMAMFLEDRNKYMEVATITPPAELAMLEKMVESGAVLHKNISQYEVGLGRWATEILSPFRNFEQEWAQLAKKIELSNNAPYRENLEKKTIVSLEKEACEFRNMAQILEWAAEAEQLMHCPQSRESIQKVGEIAASHSQALLKKELDQLSARSQKWRGTGKHLPARLQEWFEEVKQKREVIKNIAGNKGLDILESLEKKALEEVCEYLRETIQQCLHKGEAMGSYAEFLEVLHIYKEVERLDIFARHGMALPPTGDLEKLIFNQLALFVIGNSSVNNTIYEEERSRFLGVLRGSEPAYLSALDKLVQSYEALQKGAKEMASLPKSEWESKVLSPMRSFHQNWVSLASSMALSGEMVLRVEAEKAAIQSMEQQLSILSLNELRDWSSKLYPLLQIIENRNRVDKALQNTENDIRNRFQNDLKGFMAECTALSKVCEEIKPKHHRKSEEVWANFAGSVDTLKRSSEKFPRVALSFDEQTRQMLEHDAPEQVKTSVESWVKALSGHRLLSFKMTLSILETISEVRQIFQRPEAFCNITRQLEEKIAGFQSRKKKLWLCYAALIFLLCLFLSLLGFRYKLSEDVFEATSFSQENLGEYREIAEHWKALAEYPSWFFFPSDYQTVIQQTGIYRQFASLSDISGKISQQLIKEEDIRTLEKKISPLLVGQNPPEIVRKAQETLLELRALHLYYKIQQKEKIDKETITAEIQELQGIEKQMKQQIPSYRCYMLEECTKAVGGTQK